MGCLMSTNVLDIQQLDLLSQMKQKGAPYSLRKQCTFFMSENKAGWWNKIDEKKIGCKALRSGSVPFLPGAA